MAVTDPLEPRLGGLLVALRASWRRGRVGNSVFGEASGAAIRLTPDDSPIWNRNASGYRPFQQPGKQAVPIRCAACVRAALAISRTLATAFRAAPWSSRVVAYLASSR